MNYVWADRLRNIATLMVVLIHVAAPVAQSYGTGDIGWWWTGNWWNSASRPGVPLFVMLSGYLLLGKDYPTPDFLKRRFTRVLVPSLFWMAAYSYYNYKSSNNPATIHAALVKIAEGDVHYHLWFIYLIVGLYLFYPIMRPWVKQAKDADYVYLFVLCALAAWGYKILHSFFNISFGLSWEFFTNNLGYFVMGYYLGNKAPADEINAKQHPTIRPWKWSQRQLTYIAIALIVLGTSATALGSFWINVTKAGIYPRYFYDYLTPNVGFATFGWFLLAKMTLNKRPLHSIESLFSACSFGIYFVHVYILDWWGLSGYWHSKINPLICIPVIWGLAVCMTFLVVMLIRVLPFGDKIT
jgi:surface polysaccharide O-acyltransferase-like enzyme